MIPSASSNSNDHYFYLKIILFGVILKSGDVQYGHTTCVKTVTVGSAEWIKKMKVSFMRSLYIIFPFSSPYVHKKSS